MPKFPSIPRLSIVIPIGSDLTAFEDSLLSVLENRPLGCEVIVAHDGRYDDPFELTDEVRFVVGRSNRFVHLVAAGAQESRGRFVHVLASGFHATPGWIDRAIEKFEHHDAAAVVPVVRHSESNTIIAAGWIDTAARLCDPVGRGRKQVSSRISGRVGAYLHVSLWRRDVLCSLADGFTGDDSVEAGYAYEHLIRAAGWRTVLALESTLKLESPALPWDTSSASRGRRLRALRSRFQRTGGWGRSLVAAAHAVTANVARPKYWSESLGQALASLAASEMKQLLNPTAVKPFLEDSKILKLPADQRPVPRRRAA